jgi:hypothetical protein
MQSPAATAASQKDHRNPADIRTVKVTSEAKGMDTVLVADPIKGTLMLNTLCRITVTTRRPITKNRNVNNGFLYQKSSRGFAKDLAGMTE